MRKCKYKYWISLIGRTENGATNNGFATITMKRKIKTNKQLLEQAKKVADHNKYKYWILTGFGMYQ